ncbi:MAG TPA: serine/threonine-protein kinase [Trebonia sp.]|nr:serine/threonine-protein kinase [Trebonia sp.]
MCVAGAGTLVAGRYLLRSRIAATGAREEAWRADDLARGCPVAVRLSEAGPRVPAEDFLACARAAARVGHPGIMRILDYGQTGTDGIPFLVTELAETASVAVVLRAGRLEPAWVLDVIFQVSSALEAVHALGLVHQDIQPRNLLLVPGGMVKIAGSWLPGVAGPSRESATYRAPELAEGAPATPAADLYSLGAVAWECLTGTLPAWPRPGLPDTVPEEVADLVTDLVALDPAERPASAGQAAARAKGLLDHPMRPLAGEAGRADGLLLREPPPELPKSA